MRLETLYMKLDKKKRIMEFYIQKVGQTNLQDRYERVSEKLNNTIERMRYE